MKTNATIAALSVLGALNLQGADRMSRAGDCRLPEKAFVVADEPGYNSWPMIQAMGTKLVCSYSRDNALPKDGHTIDPGSRDSYVRVSSDGGRTWSPERTVADDPGIGEVNEGIGLDSTGAALLWVRCWGKGRRHELDRTVDGVKTEKIATLTPDPFPMQVMDPVAVRGLGLVSPWFAGNYRKGGANSWGILVSADDGRTWSQRVIESGLSVKEWVTEPSLVDLGGGRLLIVGRCEQNLGNQFQVTSTDNGKTWKKARTNIGDVRESTPSLVYDRETGLIANYYYHRGARQLKRRVVAADFIFDRPDAWPEPEVLDRGYETRPYDAGNVKATRLGDTDCCAWYSGTPSNSTVVVTVVPKAEASILSPETPPADDLDDLFARPPAKAHTGVWWHWMGSQVTEAGIAADLRYFRDVGISSATIFGLADVCTPWARRIAHTPNDGLEPFSPAWWRLVRFACDEAERQGVELGIHACPGYTSTGGPWITPDLAMRELVFNVTNAAVQISLESQAPYPVYIEDEGRYGRPDISARRTDLRELGVFRGVSVAHIPTGSFTQPNPYAVFGLECDKMNPAAVAFHLDHVLGEMKRYLGPHVGTTLKFVLLDSYEAGKPTWTPRMREEFAARRGYDPMDYLPILGGYTNLYSTAEVARFSADYDRTIAELFRDSLFRVMRDKLHAAGLEFACEPYVGPFDTRECAAYVDRLMGEFWFTKPTAPDTWSPDTTGWNRWRKEDGTRHNVLEAEAFTGQPANCGWSETLAAIKACGDLRYLQGVNRFTLHSNTHQPWGDDVRPGLSMGRWGTHFGRTQTWARHAKALFGYQARCQALLQWGEPTDETLPLPKPLRGIGRSDGSRRVHFVVNDSDRTVGCPPLGAEWFDPVTGTVGALPQALAPRQSGFMVFRGAKAPPRPMPRPTRQALSGNWQVSFGERTVAWPSLRDWTKEADPQIRYFSGTAVYRLRFDAGAAADGRAILDLGNLNGQSAAVSVNGRDLGVVWCAPWQVSVPAGVLRPTDNELRIEHANVWANRLIGDEQEGEDCKWEVAPYPGGSLLVEYPSWFARGMDARPAKGRKCFATWKYFDAKSPLVPSGLMGPVSLVREK